MIHKDRKHAAADTETSFVPHPGVTNVSDSDEDYVTDADGKICVDNLLPGDYWVTETVPAAYISDDVGQPYTVVNGTTCETATVLEFHNTPLTNITVSVDSQVDGGNH